MRMARGWRFLLFIVLGLATACLPEELELPLLDGGGELEASATGAGGGPQMSSDGSRGGATIDAPTRDATDDRSMTTTDAAVADGRARDAPAPRDAISDRPTTARDAPSASGDARESTAETSVIDAAPGDASDGCIPKCSALVPDGLSCNDGCGGPCQCASSLLRCTINLICGL